MNYKEALRKGRLFFIPYPQPPILIQERGSCYYQSKLNVLKSRS